MNRRTLITSLLGIVATLAPAWAMRRGSKVHYVSPQGDDKWPGTEKQPWKTLKHAFMSVEYLDQLVVRKGNYEVKNDFVIAFAARSRDVEPPRLREKKILTFQGE